MLNEERCDPDVHANGKAIFVTHTIPTAELNRWVDLVAQVSEQKVDWGYVGGRAAIKFVGDEDRVKDAIRMLKPMHDEMYRKAAKSYGSSVIEDISPPSFWYNDGAYDSPVISYSNKDEDIERVVRAYEDLVFLIGYNRKHMRKVEDIVFALLPEILKTMTREEVMALTGQDEGIFRYVQD